MIIISYSLSLRALDDYVKNHNAHHQQLNQQIRQGISDTAKNIIRLYGRRLSKVKPEVLNVSQLPPLRTNNTYLAEIGNTSSRTVQRHIKRLMDAGIITRKKFRGSRANYELWINYQLLFINPLIAVENPLRASFNLTTDNQLLINKNTSTCPDRETGNNNNIIKDLSKCPGQWRSKKIGSTRDAEGTGYTGEKARKNVTTREKTRNTRDAEGTGYTGEKAQKNTSERQKTGNTGCEILAGGAAEKSPKKERKNHQEKEGAGEKARMQTDIQKADEMKRPKFDKVRSASLSLYSTLLWALAKRLLYADVFLTKRQCEIGRQLIREWYEPVATEKLGTIHQVYVSRIGLVRKFLDKDLQNRYVQLPYRYFDINNPSGFRGTKKWWLKQQKRNIAIEESLVVHHQIKKLKHNKNKDGSESLPPLQLYAQCETRVRELGNTELLQKFYTAVSTPDKQLTTH